MFCPECGATLPDEARFCTKCGALTAREEIAETTATLTNSNNEDTTNSDAITSDGVVTQDINEAAEPSPRKKPKGKIVAAVIAAILAICGIGGFAAYSHSQGQVYTLLAAPVADGYDEGDATPMPVEVTGTDANGNEVDEVFYVTPDHGIEMPKGDYELIFPDPIASGSSIFVPGTETTRALVGEDGWIIDPDGEAQAADAINVNFKLVAPEDITDEMIEQLKAWMEKAGLSDSEIERFANAVTNARQERLDQIAEEEEAARKAAEEEAARKAEEERKAAEEAASRTISLEEAIAIATERCNREHPGFQQGGSTKLPGANGEIIGYEIRFSDPSNGMSAIYIVNPDGSFAS